MAQCRYCSYTARWEGLCLSCYQRSGRAEERRAEELAREAAERRERAEREQQRAVEKLLELGDQQLPWWDISERLNRAGLRLEGAPWTPTSARGHYVALRDEWD